MVRRLKTGSAYSQRGKMPSVFRLNGHTMSIQDCEKMSDEELYRLLMENVPAVAETVRKVTDSNRETVIAFLRFLSNETG